MLDGYARQLYGLTHRGPCFLRAANVLAKSRTALYGPLPSCAKGCDQYGPYSRFYQTGSPASSIFLDRSTALRSEMRADQPTSLPLRLPSFQSRAPSQSRAQGLVSRIEAQLFHDLAHLYGSAFHDQVDVRYRLWNKPAIRASGSKGFPDPDRRNTLNAAKAKKAKAA